MTKRQPRFTKVEITHDLPNLFSPSKIVIDGKRVEGASVSVERSTADDAVPVVRIDGGRVLYPTEVWLNGVLMARVDGLLGQGRKSGKGKR